MHQPTMLWIWIFAIADEFSRTVGEIRIHKEELAKYSPYKIVTKNIPKFPRQLKKSLLPNTFKVFVPIRELAAF